MSRVLTRGLLEGEYPLCHGGDIGGDAPCRIWLTQHSGFVVYQPGRMSKTKIGSLKWSTHAVLSMFPSSNFMIRIQAIEFFAEAFFYFPYQYLSISN
jgi:hypothetical protein